MQLSTIGSKPSLINNKQCMSDKTPMQDAPEQAQDFEQPSGAPKSGGAARWLVVIIIIAAIILGGLYLVSTNTKYNILGVNHASGDWQAVFLSNGQVYFGKIANETREEVTLIDIYYLQITQPLQRSGEQAGQAAQQNELALVELGNEIHGPTSKMRINRDHVLFIEDLKTDSKVVEAIEQSREEN